MRLNFFAQSSNPLIVATIFHGRKILPGRFNLKAAIKEWTRRRNGESKECSSQLARQPAENQLSGKISSVVLRVVQEHATLTLMDAEIDTDVHTFVNIAVIWALSELDFFDRDALSDEQLRRRGLTSSGLPEDLTSCDYTRTFPSPFRFGPACIRIRCIFGFSWLLVYTNEATCWTHGKILNLLEPCLNLRGLYSQFFNT